MEGLTKEAIREAIRVMDIAEEDAGVRAQALPYAMVYPHQ